MKKLMVVLALATGLAAAQDNPQVNSTKAFYSYMKDNVTRTAAKVPEEVYAFHPADFAGAPPARTFGQILAHIADTQMFFCGLVQGKTVARDFEHKATTKADIVKAVAESFALCDAAYASMTDANSAEMVPFRGNKFTKLGAIQFNTAHGLEHYGNLVVYMRLNKIVAPTSEEAPKPAAK